MLIPFKYILEQYKSYLTTLGFASTTVYDFTKFVNHFFNYITAYCGVFSIDHLKEEHVQCYFKHLQQAIGKRTKKAFSTSHLNRQFLAIDKLLLFLEVLEFENTPLPTAYQLPRESVKEIAVLSISEINELYKAIGFTFDSLNYSKQLVRQKTLTLILNLCYGCGLRRSEALSVRLTDIDYENKYLFVGQGKNYKDRYVPLNGNLVSFFQEYSYHHRREIIAKPNRVGYLYPFGATAIKQGFELIVNQIENQTLLEKKPTLHTLRHSIATHLLHNGMEIEQISQFLGHSSLRSTQIYTHIAYGI